MRLVRRTNRFPKYLATLLTELTGLSCLVMLVIWQPAFSKSGSSSTSSLPSEVGLPGFMAVVEPSSMKYDSIVQKGSQFTLTGINTWTSNGPIGADVHSLAIDPSNPATIYAGTVGVWKSVNCGGNWSHSVLSNGFLALVIHPTNASTIYGGGNEGVFKSTDAGITWSKIGLSEVNSLAIDPKNPTTLYAGVGSGPRVYKSIDGGTSWSNSGSLSSFGFGTVDALAIDPINTTTIYAALADASIDGGVYKSTDGGGNWVRTTLPSGVRSLAVDPNHPTTLYAGTELNFLSPTGVYKSTDGGDSWNLIKTSTPPLLLFGVRALAVDPSNPTTVYVGEDGRVFKSTDGGTSWSVLGTGLPADSGIWALAVDQSGNSLHAGLGPTGSGVYDFQYSGGCAPPPTPTPTPTSTPTPPPVTNVQFSSATYTVAEGAGSASITLTRSGDTSSTSSVDYQTNDTFNFVECNVNNGAASQRCDYITTNGTLTFAPNETAKSFSMPIIDDAYPESNETLILMLSNPMGGFLGAQSTTVLTIVDNDPSAPPTNPLDNADALFFVRQHYLDFLNREPDPGGFAYWAARITECGSDQLCIRSRRIAVSNAFFYELEFQQTGSYVFRLYRASYGDDQPFPNTYVDPRYPEENKKLPSYAVFVPDRARVVGGANLAQAQVALANDFVQRPEFLARYPANLTGPQFVDAVLATIRSSFFCGASIGPDLSLQRDSLITLFNQAGRGAMMYRLADDNPQTNPINNRAFIDAMYNSSFVLNEYFGYLRRDPDIEGFHFWLCDQVNRFPIRNGDIQHAMVCSFITSAEYQLRFGSVVSHTNQECPQ
jgi:hypothetical protein